MGLIKRLIRRKVKTPVKRAVRRKVTRPARKRFKAAATVKCGACGKRYTNPLAHTCTVKSDFKRRKAAADRAKKREAARARRKAAADRRKAAAADRRRKAREKRSAPRSAARPQHDFRACQDDECRRYACVGYKAGYADAEADAGRESA